MAWGGEKGEECSLHIGIKLIYSTSSVCVCPFYNNPTLSQLLLRCVMCTKWEKKIQECDFLRFFFFFSPHHLTPLLIVKQRGNVWWRVDSLRRITKMKNSWVYVCVSGARRRMHKMFYHYYYVFSKKKIIINNQVVRLFEVKKKIWFSMYTTPDHCTP